MLKLLAGSKCRCWHWCSWTMTQCVFHVEIAASVWGSNYCCACYRSRSGYTAAPDWRVARYVGVDSCTIACSG
jgi:hypothetical protein